MAGLTAERRIRVKEPAARPAAGAGMRRDPAYVRWIQESLNRLIGAGLAVDGLLGPRTAAATRVFQTRRGLTADGIVGPLTERALVAAGADPPPLPGAPPAPPAPFGPADVADPRIAPEARQSLLRMRGDPLAVRDAVGMLQAVKTRTLGGITREDQAAAGALARLLRRPPGQLVPAGEDAALVLAAPSATPPPLIVYRAGLPPARLDRALRRAWATFLQTQSRIQFSPRPVCLRPEAIPVGAVAHPLSAVTPAGLLANLVPRLPLCQIRPRPRPRPPTPPPAPVDPWATVDATENLLFFPENIRRPARIDILKNPQGGLDQDATRRQRLSVILGPGATPRGIARRLLPLYTAAHSVPVPGAGPAPTVDELAMGILVYNETYLPLEGFQQYRDGLRLPLPIEIDQRTANFIVNGEFVRLLATRFPAGSRQLLDATPAHLPQPDPDTLQTEVRQLLQQHTAQQVVNPHAIAVLTFQRMLRNPFEGVFFAFEVFRQLGANAFDPVLVGLSMSAQHQVELLASLTAGQAWLRRLLTVVEPVRPGLAPAIVAMQARALSMLRTALGLGIGATTREPRELPETPLQLAARPGRVTGGRTADPVAGSHRMVLGRDVLAGSIGTFRNRGNSFTGPAFAGRLTPAQFAAEHARLLPQNDNQFTQRLRIVLAIAANEGLLDAIRMQDAGILSTGIQQWSAHSDSELPSLLQRFKDQAPDEFQLYFALYGLDVRPDRGNNAMLQRIRPDGRRDDLPVPQRLAFFGGTSVTTGVGRRAVTHTTFATDWAARFREASVTSLQYRRAQILQATARFDRIRAEVGSIAVTLAGRRATIAIDQLITSQLGVAFILDSHINQPGNVRRDIQAAANAVGNQPTIVALDRAITRQYAATRSVFDRDTRNANINGRRLSADPGSFTGW